MWSSFLGAELVDDTTGPSLSASVGAQSIQIVLTIETCMSTLSVSAPIHSMQVIRRLGQVPIIGRLSPLATRIATGSITVMNAEVLSHEP